MFIFDTNAFYDLATEPFRGAADMLQERGRSGTLELKFTPLAIIEIVDRLKRDPARFDQLKRGATIMHEAGAKSLPDPELRMAEIVLDGTAGRDRYSVWNDILHTLMTAPDAANLEQGFDDYTTGTRRSVDVTHMSQFRESTEEDYVNELADLVRNFNPRYDRQVARGRAARVAPPDAAGLEAFLGGGQWTTIFRQILEDRGGFVVPTDPGKVGVIDRKAALFKAGYEWLLRKVFVDGRHVTEERKNDYNDLHLLLYVNEFAPADVVVSSDEGVILSVARPSTRAMTLRDFVSGTLRLRAPPPLGPPQNEWK